MTKGTEYIAAYYTIKRAQKYLMRLGHAYCYFNTVLCTYYLSMLKKYTVFENKSE